MRLDDHLPNKDPWYFSFPLILVAASALSRDNLPPNLVVLDVLPQVHIPVGMDGDTVVMKALYDSGAGLNMDRCRYHEAVKAMRPDIVVQFIDFANSEYNPLAIGRVDRQAWGPDINACIIYKLPYTMQGFPATLTIGLADECIINTLVSLPFMIKAKLVHDTAERIVMSGVFGSTWQIRHERPFKVDALPTYVGGGEGTAVLSTTGEMVYKRE